MKQFIKRFEKKKEFKGLEKFQLSDILYQYQDDVIDFYLRKSFKDKETREALFDIMEQKHFIKAISNFIKNKEGEYDVDIKWTVVISEFLAYRVEKLDEKVTEKYDKLLDKLLKKSSKEMSDKTGLSKDVAKELLIVAPCKEISDNKKFVNIYVSRVLRKLYLVVREEELVVDEKLLKRIFKFLFTKDVLGYVAMTILLEKKTAIKDFTEAQLTAWNALTAYAISVLEKTDKKELVEILNKYKTIRNNAKQANTDSARRINLSQLTEEDFPHIAEAVKKVNLD